MTDNNPASTRTMLIPTGTPNKQVIVTRQVRQRKSAGATKAMVVEDAAEPTPATVARAQRMSRDQVQSAMLSSSKALRGVVDIVAAQTASKVRQLCNSRPDRLCAKVQGCRGMEQGLYQQFKGKCVDVMNQAMETLKELKFESQDAAVNALCQITRSFVPCMAPSLKQIASNKDGSQRAYYQCNSVTNTKKQQGQEKCGWKAMLRITAQGEAQFETIGDFGCHLPSCLTRKVRFTHSEVVQASQVHSSMAHEAQMAGLIQPVPRNSCYALQWRQRQAAGVHARKQFNDFVQQHGDIHQAASVCNLQQEQLVQGTVSEDVMLLVKTLMALHSQDQATVYGEFERAETGVVLPKQLYFMWPFQKQRMVTHADCIMCDSLWKAEKGGCNDMGN